MNNRFHLPGSGGGYPVQTNRIPTKMPPSTAQALGLATQEGARTEYDFETERVVLAGGDFGSQILIETYTPFEYLFRALPEEGMFDSGVSPERPFEFSLGAFVVPPRMVLLIFNMRPDVYRFSGVDAGDFVPVEERRFASIMGFEFLIKEEHKGNINFQIDPVPIQRTSLQAFQSSNIAQPVANAGDFARARAGGLAVAQGSSNMLLPQRPTRYGPPAPIPFTLFAKPGEPVEARCTIFRPMPSAIAFIEFDFTGILVPQDFLKAQEALKFPQITGTESIR